MISITLSSEISEACPDLHVLAIACQVKNTEPDERLWEEITRVEEDIRSTCKIEDINKWTPIFATRQAYKRLGKDPNRYRPSAEALRRRILRGLPLYKIDTLVDIVNLDVPQIFSNLVEKYQLEPKLLLAEITETMLAENASLVENTIQGLHRKGFSVMMDDFGSGYS